MMKNSSELKRLLMLPFCTLFFFIGAVMAQAATYYVATTGSDTYSCASAQTVNTPKRTIASGVACLNAGDTLYIRAGTWTTAIDLSAKTGTASNWITVAAYPGDIVTIQPTAAGGAVYGTRSANTAYIIIDGFVFDGINGPNGTGLNIDNGTHDWIFQNLDVKRWHYNGFLVGNKISTPGNATNITIRNCTIHDQIGQDVVGFRYYGIYWGLCDNCTIEGNDIYNNPGGGMQVYPGPSSNLVVRNNKFHHNNSLSSSSVGGILIYEEGTISNLKIYNNLIYNNGSSSSGNATGIELNSGVQGVKVWNNTVYGNKSYGIFAAPGTGSHEIRNNSVYLNGLGEILNQGTGDIVDHNLTTNPSFVDAATSNFNLLTTSPAIDAGVTLSSVTTDFKKTSRPQGGAYDIGAYEVGSDTAPPNPPQNLSVR